MYLKHTIYFARPYSRLLSSPSLPQKGSGNRRLNLELELLLDLDNACSQVGTSDQELESMVGCV